MRCFIAAMTILGVLLFADTTGTAQSKEAQHTAHTGSSRAGAESDPVVGKTKDGKPVYEGAKGGFYYVTGSGNRAYVKDFVGAKIVGKTADGLPVYEGPRGGRFYYNVKGDKVYLSKK